MHQLFAHPLLATTALVGIMAWRLFAQGRRVLARQPFSRTRLILTVLSLPAVLAFTAFVLFKRPGMASGMALGMCMGALLGVLGSWLAKFDRTSEGLFFTPNAYLGSAFMLAFLGQLAYELVRWVTRLQASTTPDVSDENPLSLATFGGLSGYYIVYAVGLLLKRRRLQASKR